MEKTDKQTDNNNANGQDSTVKTGKNKQHGDDRFAQYDGYVMDRAEGLSARGRHIVFREELADIVLDRLASGESLRAICRDPTMPDGSTIRKWIARLPDFAKQYAIAREEQADSIFDETLDIADRVPPEAPNEEIQRARLRIDTRKWVAGKLRPKKYGDLLKHEVTGANGGAIAMQAVNVGQLDYDQREALAGMLEQLAVASPETDDDL
jgi:hypothetical protein